MSTPEAPTEGSPLRRTVEHVDGLADRAVRRAGGSAGANPLVHAGTISVFLLVVVTLSGIYITLFFEFGHQASYDSAQRLTDHPIQHLMRSVHRYASAALVATTAVHAWRVFAAGRFTAGRRFRWLTGVFGLGLVWLAGVTGYVLVADQRAQAIGGAVAELFGALGIGAGAIAEVLIDSAAGRGGSGLFLLVWFAHLGLTAVIGWAMWRHLRRSRQPILPPRHWMAAAGATLLLVSLLLPADLLDRADASRLVPDMALDPFMLFLLPPLRSGAALPVAAAMLVAGAVLAVVPWVLRDRVGTVVVIDDEACTGCDLCVVDCPYLALELVDTDERPVARLDPSACVGCGICLGSCSFGAISMEGHPTAAGIECADRDVVVTCRRQDRHLGAEGDTVVVALECAGAMHPALAAELSERGARSVEVAGCGPGECGYGLGNQLLHERLIGTRAPHPARRDQGLVAEHYPEVGVSLRGLARTSPDPDARELPGSLRARLVGAGLVLVSLVAIGMATLLPFAGDTAAAGVRVVTVHRPGDRLEGQTQPSGGSDTEAVVTITVDGATVATTTLDRSGDRVAGVTDGHTEAGRRRVEVVLTEGSDRSVVFAGEVDLADGRYLFVPVVDVPPDPGVAEGRAVFSDPRAGSCTLCHSVERGKDGVGPSLYGLADRAGSTVAGLDAEAYLRQSVLEPDAYVVEGWPAGQMLPDIGDRLTDTQFESLVEYLLTLEGGS